MARTSEIAVRNLWLCLWFLALVPVVEGSSAFAQSTPPAAAPPVATKLSECKAALDSGASVSAPLANVARALEQRRKIKVLVLGQSAVLGRVGGRNYTELVEKYLESVVKGLDVEIIHRGIAGELARDSGERLKMEVGLVGADIVLWQVGTADALAQVPVEDFRTSVIETLDWLKEHSVDVVLIGLRYFKKMQDDQHYQALRKSLRAIAMERSLLRVGRYEATEALTQIRQHAAAAADSEPAELPHQCMAEQIARAITAGVFLRKKLKDNSSPSQ